jgi:hypothetical protein
MVDRRVLFANQHGLSRKDLPRVAKGGPMNGSAVFMYLLSAGFVGTVMMGGAANILLSCTEKDDG